MNQCNVSYFITCPDKVEICVTLVIVLLEYSQACELQLRAGQSAGRGNKHVYRTAEKDGEAHN